LSKSVDVQKIAAGAEKISRFIYNEGFLVIEKAKSEEISEIVDELEAIFKRIKRISVRNIE
jgi:hypothetical protein